MPPRSAGAPSLPSRRRRRARARSRAWAGFVVLIGIIAGVCGGGSDKTDDSKPDTTAAKKEKPAADKDSDKSDNKAGTRKESDKKTVVFKVWGTAPAGALGPLDITYGSDSDNRKGKFANGRFEATCL
ncbi:hypothetical protein [Streptomyces sp. NPDC003374]